ncbi:Serine--tRNA ligase [Candidatus Cyrtobacter comes]|uniref:Serine--tRNA ligase n=1 Tax=Candidatus Cyrtobacter comes TaxID=675776 RepID=A0ABU5L7G5_9RICK|nr:serine--tRNA ligase [Candidatus Cyrtobacter comes]MDZ5762064.1 Serine--tRNA ligase [Candidatus Cyrtobacter comes]
MLDIKFIRENPEAFDKEMQRRGQSYSAAQILALDEEIRSVKTIMQGLQSQRNKLAKEFGMAKTPQLLAESTEKIKQAISDEKAKLDVLESDFQKLMSSIPNILFSDVPNGSSESENVTVRNVGEKKSFSFLPKQHFELLQDSMLFEKAAEIAGSRFVLLKGGLAKLERAIASFMLDIHTNEFGYTEVSVPYLVNHAAMFATGQLPKFSQDLFAVEDKFYLIPTAEVPLTNLVSNSIVDENELPLRFVAHTQCFRSEAGSAGKDTRGMLRQHQFAKVELVSITSKESSNNELERILNCAEEVLKRLEIPYRVQLLCSGDIGFSSTKTYDIEVWLPGQNCYREISSCSNCMDFQARRMDARYKDINGNKEFLHTLNGSGLAVGRTLIAILENYQNSDGSITIPTALKKYMGGISFIK